jgi:hypothetical protein
VERYGNMVKTKVKLKAGYAWDRYDVGMNVESDGNSVELGEWGVMYRTLLFRLRAEVAL